MVSVAREGSNFMYLVYVRVCVRMNDRVLFAERLGLLKNLNGCAVTI